MRYGEFALLASMVLAWACGDATGPDGSGLPPGTVDGGSWYQTGFRWPHDGNPYETPNFIVYSDAASLEARRQLAEIGEDLLADLSADFQIAGNTMFRFPPGQTRIHMYAYKDRYPREWGGWAYYGGLLIFSLDHEGRTRAGHTELGNYTRVVKHELMHVIQHLLVGAADVNLVDAWLTEGLGEYVSGGTAGGSITSLARLDELTGTYGELNPIAMHGYDYPDIELIAYNYYYPMFQLAVRYLLDPLGGGNARTSLRDLFLDVAARIPFATAFENRLGVGLLEYENHFFDRIRAYLN